MPAAPTSAMSDLCMCSPHETGRVADPEFD
jgi:hypothetical protein